MEREKEPSPPFLVFQQLWCKKLSLEASITQPAGQAMDGERTHLGHDIQSLIREKPLCNYPVRRVKRACRQTFNRSFARSPYATRVLPQAVDWQTTDFQSLIREKPLCN
ncbi:MAG TPA: hypothetical protein VKU38_11070 [Ktedonobacteraceae bacterium]|nr:hypothetical protein [Ktedonobacteraceae bacterium]